MAAVDWYFARGSKQMGPVASAELKRMAVSGELRPNDLVWREGLTEWTLARNVHGLFEAEKPGTAEPSPAETITAAERATPAEQSARAAGPRGERRHLVQVLLDAIRSAVSVPFVEAMGQFARRCGRYGLLAAIALVMAFAIVEAVNGHKAGGLTSGVAMVVLLAVLHYVAGRFCNALDRLNRITHGSLVSNALPDILAILSLVVGAGTLLGAVSAPTWPLILSGVAALAVCFDLAFVALYPATLNVWIASNEAAPSEEALGALVFLMKIAVAAAPVIFGVGVVCSTICMGVACGQALSGGVATEIAPTTAALARLGLIASAALPLVAYLLLLPGFLLVDLCRTILSVPEKLDKAATPEESEKPGE